MFRLTDNDSKLEIDAINKSQAKIEFEPNGKILFANNKFLDLMKYDLNDIKGQYHKIFVEPDYVNSDEYITFWKTLNKGENLSKIFKRKNKVNEDVWLQASYNPVLKNNKVIKIIKYATDITNNMLKNADYKGQIEAINRSQAVIEFEMDGSIIRANENFLNISGYKEEEIKGKHHSIFLDKEYSNSREYKDFWEKLNKGEFFSAEFQRFGKNNKEVWIQATYNPIFDCQGRPFKVVKYATDISSKMAARSKANKLASSANQHSESIASASEEMLSSIQEISRSMNETKHIVDLINENTNRTNSYNKELLDESEKMHDIVKLISNIADQVKMLSLNATIEAVRAGEAGKGFAVVANEVKELASQTSQATEQILNSVSRVQDKSKRAFESTGEIVKDANSVNEYVNIVASAIEEQTAVTNDITVNISDIFKEISDLDNCVKDISK